jgi:hypothetical protein
VFIRAAFDKIKYLFIISTIVAIQCLFYLFNGDPDFWVMLDLSVGFVLIACIIWSKGNPDTRDSLLIILIGHGLSFVLFNAHQNNLPWNVSCYLISICTLYFCRVHLPKHIANNTHKKSKANQLILISAAFLFISILSEVYWAITKYENAPAISWSWLVICIYFWQRKLLNIRPILILKYTKLKATFSELDYSLRVYCGIPIVIELCKILEYIVRHTTSYSPLLIYNSYIFLVNISNMILVIVAIVFTYKTEKKRQLQA